MDKTFLSNIVEVVKKGVNIGEGNPSFSPLVNELVQLYNTHHTLRDNLNSIEMVTASSYLSGEFEIMRQNLSSNMEKVLEAIGRLTDRQMKVYITEQGDTLWKISTKYNCSIKELYELNSIRNILSIEKDRIILVPKKIPH